MRPGILLVLFVATVLGEMNGPSQRVGQPLILTDIYIPGGEAKPAPRRDRQPSLAVRRIDLKPAEDGFRYDFEIQGFDPGRYDLADYLVAVNPTDPPRFPKIPLEIQTDLKPGLHLPHEIQPGALPSWGGYRAAMVGIGIFWTAGFAGLLWWLRHQPVAVADVEKKIPTAAERLRPLLREASSGQLDAAGRAQLERLMIGFWRERLPEIGALPPVEAMVRLRSHAEAAPLLLAVEEWLHARRSTVTPQALETLLAPYR